MEDRASRIELFKLGSIQMRVFHLAWLAFFVCFFAWFAVAPLMPVIRKDLGLTGAQIANINIAAVFATILVRLLIGPLCDRFGARRTYTWLLTLGAVPVIGIGLCHSYLAFLFCRLCVGAIGASFVITQFHTTLMFAPNVVGTANAAAAGWGNSGGGATQALMPLILAVIVGLGVSQSLSWRLAMIVPGAMMLLMAFLYYRYARDTPRGNLSEPRNTRRSGWRSFQEAAGNYRVWMLFIAYGACFGIELTIHNFAATYYVDRFSLDVRAAGLYAGSFGLLALFARALGGFLSDRTAHRHGLDGRVRLLFFFIVAEGLGLATFSRMDAAQTALVAMLAFGLFTHMACGATYSLTPFVHRGAFGGVAGIIGAGGNAGAVAAGFLLKSASGLQHGLLLLGLAVTGSALCVAAVRFSPDYKLVERQAYAQALDARRDADAMAADAVSS